MQRDIGLACADLKERTARSDGAAEARMIPFLRKRQAEVVLEISVAGFRLDAELSIGWKCKFDVAIPIFDHDRADRLRNRQGHGAIAVRDAYRP